MEFSQQLTQNVKQATVAALIATVIEDDSRTIGDILDSLEADQDAEFLTQTFRDLTVAKLLEAAQQLSGMKHAAETAARRDLEGEDEYEDKGGEEEGEEGEYGEAEVAGDPNDLSDDDDLSDLEDEEETTVAPIGRGARKKSPPPRKRRANGKDEEGSLPLHDPEVQKEYQSNIVKFLRKYKDPKGSQGAPATSIRTAVGGTPAQVRENLNELIESSRVSYSGKARGTRYHLTE